MMKMPFVDNFVVGIFKYYLEIVISTWVDKNLFELS